MADPGVALSDNSPVDGLCRQSPLNGSTLRLLYVPLGSARSVLTLGRTIRPRARSPRLRRVRFRAPATLPNELLATTVRVPLASQIKRELELNGVLARAEDPSEYRPSTGPARCRSGRSQRNGSDGQAHAPAGAEGRRLPLVVARGARGDLRPASAATPCSQQHRAHAGLPQSLHTRWPRTVAVAWPCSLQGSMPFSRMPLVLWAAVLKVCQLS